MSHLDTEEAPPDSPNNGFDAALTAIADELAEGKVVPFLGAGVNLCDRPPGTRWDVATRESLPSARELAEYLARRFSYPESDRDLSRLCQFVVEVRGDAPLYAGLRKVFTVPPSLNRVHRFLARLPGRLRHKGYLPKLLIVTTNYDDQVEKAFAETHEPLQVVSYVAEGGEDVRGKFAHHGEDGRRDVIFKPNEYTVVAPERGPVLLKIHGAVDRDNEINDSYVVTEDHYIEFLSRADLANFVPVHLAAQLRTSHFLFLGYSLKDWNLRVVLQRIWDAQRLRYNSWAVHKDTDLLDRSFWARRNVSILTSDLARFIDDLSGRIDRLPPNRG
jgi:hypothetical protein